MQYIIETQNVSKHHNGKVLLEDINIKVRVGDIYGLLGPNGAGKTTFMKILLNLIKPTTGTLTFLGQRVGEHDYKYLQAIGSIIEAPFLYEKVSGRENLAIHAKYMNYHQVGRIDEVLEIVGLQQAGDELVQRYSLGMKQRLAIAKAILTKPKLLILDEPINGLDPAGISEIRKVLKRLQAVEGTTIIISSHILSELEQLVDTVTTLDKGHVVETKTMDEIHQQSTRYFVLETPDVERALAFLTTDLHLNNVRLQGKQQINIYDDAVSYQEILRALNTLDIEIIAFSKAQGNLEDYYFEKTDKEAKHV